MPCLAEDELLALGRGGSLGDSPEAEAHLADCATCTALLASLVRDETGPRWDALTGAALGPYRLDAQIGAGGMSAVYRAWDDRLGRNVAVKVVHASATERRLAIEARAAGAISHPAIVAVHDIGVADGVTYIVQELVDGETLRSVIERGALSAERAAALAVELARGLAAAHAHGVVHRDLKPENLLVTRDGHLKILDFGLARLLEVGPLDATEPGVVQGTTGYLAPEQARGEPADARADVFAAGAVIFEMLTGARAFPGASHAERLSAVLRDAPALDDPRAAPFAPILARCLAKDPRDRFQSAADLAWVLDAPRLPPAPARHATRRRVLAGAGALALAGFALGRWTSRSAAPAAARPVFRQLTYRTGRVFTARFTRDGGRIVLGAAWDAEPLTAYAIDLAGGPAQPLDAPAGDVLAVSARGELALSLGRRFTDHQSATGTLALAPLAGGAPRALAEDVQDADFSPDGGDLAVVRRTERGFGIDLPLGRSVVAGDGWITHARISPDGARIAYLLHPSVQDDRGDVMVVDVATRRARTVSPGWASIAGLAWDPDGSSLWFTAAREGAQCAIQRATLDGAVDTIAQTTGRLRLHDLAADRRAAITVDVWRLRALVGAPGQAGEIDRSLSDFSLVTDISADGATLLIAEIGDVDASIGAYLQPVSAGRPLRLGAGMPLAISPSGQRVAAFVLADDRLQLVAYSTTSAGTTPIATAADVSAARWLDETALIAEGAPGAGARMWKLSTAGAPVALTDPGDAGHPALDPARRRCAFVDPRGRLHLLDVAGGGHQTLDGSFAGLVACGWLADHDSIIVRSATTPIRLTRVDPRTGATSAYLEIAPPPVGLRAVDAVVLRADGSAYAYSVGQELSQLYLLTLMS